MDKAQIQEKKSKKSCFGTKEWSRNSGICKGCKLKKACGQIRLQKE